LCSAQTPQLPSRANSPPLTDILRDPTETLTSALLALLRAAFLTGTGLALENAALRQQPTTSGSGERDPHDP
jgi:hypothetical protein